MRFRVDVAAEASVIPWEDVHGAARGVVYDVLAKGDPALARQLHARKGADGPRPVGVTPPQFRGARSRAGAYTTSADGAVWFGSPLMPIAGALVAGLTERSELRWGRTGLFIRGVEIDTEPQQTSAENVLETATPVLVKVEGRYLLPQDERYVEHLSRNLSHKADILGLPRPTKVRVLQSGPRRRFAVKGAPRIGAWLRVGLTADPQLAEALRSWGLGLDTMQGFGWVR